MTRIDIINYLLKGKERSTYLEIGVRTGACFFRINAKHKVGVDPSFLISKKRYLKEYLFNINNFNNRFFKETSDDFFAKRKKFLKKINGFDVIFIDGLHMYDQVLKDVENGLNHLKPDGFIVLHDCNPQNRLAALRAFSPDELIEKYGERFNGVWNGDVWKVIPHLRSRGDLNLDISVIDCDHGIGIIKKSKEGNKLVCNIENLSELTYEDLDRNRIEWLNLKSPNYIKDLIK